MKWLICFIFLTGSCFAGDFSIRHFAFQQKEYTYVIYTPTGNSPKSGWPLILFLHGIGESGADGKSLIHSGIGAAAIKHPELYPAMIIMPQIPVEDMQQVRRVGFDGDISWNRDESEKYALAVFQHVYQEYRDKINAKKIYLTGLSMGGSGTWRIAASKPEIFTAIAPIAACKQLDNLNTDTLTRVPIWTFHGAKDETCPVQNAREIAQVIKEKGGNIQYTEYPTANHVETWKKAYANPGFLAWLFKQTKL